MRSWLLLALRGQERHCLQYDIAKKLRERGEEVLILHSGILNEGQRVLRDEYRWNIHYAGSLNFLDLSKFNVVIVDESQRIWMWQFELLVGRAKEHNIKILFSYDEAVFA